ncbi:MAG: heme-copper oxidase subunit III [Candidatus Methylomirabilis oxyfera]|nr:heme-copper oxidase subunit III [Candidatus Methylomirabilis oxyfera]
MPRTEAVSPVVNVETEQRIEASVRLGARRPPPFTAPPTGEDPLPPSPDPRTGPPVSNARLGMVIFLAFEGMFFAGLIGAFLVFRFGSQPWPPVGQPRLPILVTWANTAILLFSSVTMRYALRTMRMGDRNGLTTGLSGTAMLGTIFLIVQGSEWFRLVRHGLTLSAGIYGATFYTLIGCHGLHVLGAVIWLLIVRVGSRDTRFSARRQVGVELCGMYWYFVVALWPILFALVYLS